MCATCGCGGGEGQHAADERHAHEPHDHEHHHHHAPLGHERPLGGARGRRIVRLERDILADNDHRAAHNRDWLDRRGVFALNLMGAPGAGKTALVERTVAAFAGRIAVSVVEGDQETRHDADRVERAGARVAQINTGSGCHLDARMVGGVLAALAPPPRSLLVVENVGNLVCPALFDLGEHAKAVVLSVAEGDDKPEKYPPMFRAADLLVLNKIDLLPYVDFDVERCIEAARRVNPRLRVFPLSARTGDGVDAWCAWLEEKLASAPSATV